LKPVCYKEETGFIAAVSLQLWRANFVIFSVTRCSVQQPVHFSFKSF